MKSILLALLPLAAFAQTPDTVNTYAGGGPNNLPATSANVSFAVNTAVDSSGNFYYVLSGGYFEDGSGTPSLDRVYEVNASGTVIVVAGNGSVGWEGDPGYGGDGGPATEAVLYNPSAAAVDSSGNVYIADTNNCIVRKVTKSTGIINTYAGTAPTSMYGPSCGYSGGRRRSHQRAALRPMGRRPRQLRKPVHRGYRQLRRPGGHSQYRRNQHHRRNPHLLRL